MIARSLGAAISVIRWSLGSIWIAFGVVCVGWAAWLIAHGDAGGGFAIGFAAGLLAMLGWMVHPWGLQRAQAPDAWSMPPRSWLIAAAPKLGVRFRDRHSATPPEARAPVPRRRFRPVRGIGEWVGFLGGIVVLVAVLALVGWNVERVRNGDVTVDELLCMDPGDVCNWSAYRVRNDSGQPVVLRECRHQCGAGDRRYDAIGVRPGEVTANSAREVSAAVGQLVWWEVRTSGGRMLGCLILDGHRHKHDGDLVAISARAPCRAQMPATPVQAA